MLRDISAGPRWRADRRASLEGSPNGFGHGAKVKPWLNISRVEAGSLESGCVAIGRRPDCGRSRWAACGRHRVFPGFAGNWPCSIKSRRVGRQLTGAVSYSHCRPQAGANERRLCEKRTAMSTRRFGQGRSSRHKPIERSPVFFPPVRSADVQPQGASTRRRASTRKARASSRGIESPTAALVSYLCTMTMSRLGTASMNWPK